MKKNSKTQEAPVQNSAKRAYKKPKITSDSLLAFGALCNGRTGGGRKDSASAPASCQTSRLLS